ncbi:TonB-dependent receptor family protein [Gramella jeungdoensis]|uniref:TonB-dependent receptor family protein n=1 Tax=Gramella jeungdoensis TaxID=708091 RepID=A0ABT0YZM2_9FLAO|nr:outer membrane beta-barrel family protein [Gramella jeungdoensis]MCM8568926.1 TonB-dependent receptor family protein [Gramella jeungdoensis]
MKLYQKLLLGIVGCLISSAAFAQGGQSSRRPVTGALKGTLIDEKEVSVPFATVVVMSLPDSTVVTGSTTDMDGVFELKAPKTGKYFLKFSSIGYTTSFTPAFEVIGPVFNKDFGKVLLKEEATMLNEVMVKSWRPQVKVENGKMVMRVEGTAIAAGNTAYDMLSRAPGVTVDQSGGFRIHGKKGASVMLDGRLTYLSSKELQTLLEGMPAENIKEIEVIHTPSAKQDAEGTSGILNIVLKENTMQGFNTSIYAGFRYGKQKFPNAGVNLSHRAGKWDSFFNLDLSSRGMYRTQDVVRTFPGTEEASVYRQKGVQEIRNLVPTLHLGSDYEITDDHSVGFMANLTYRDTESDWNTKSTLGDPVEGDFVKIDSKNHMDDVFKNGRFNLHYTGELDTIGTTLSADLDYARLETDSESGFTNQYFYTADDREEQERLANDKFSFYDIYAARIDLKLPFSESSYLETGLKASKVVSDSDLNFFRFEEGNFTLDPAISDRFRYEENIYAVYASYSNKINDTWDIKLGLRVEQTEGDALLYSSGETSERDYLKFFPNVMIEQHISENYQLNYSYNRRITRPNYQFLNPAIFYLDPYSYVLGNPDLKPQITNSLKITQTIFKKFNLLLGYDFARDYMNESPSTNPETGETIFTTRNLRHYRSYNATLVAPVTFASFWTSNNNLVVTQEEYNMDIDGENLDNDNLFYMLQSNHQLSLPGELSLELNGTFRGPVASGIYTVDGMWWVDAGLKKSFLDDRLNASLSFTDVFRSRKMHVEAEYVGNTFTLDQYFFNQAVSLNLRYSFNKAKKAEKKSRPQSLEELNRAGG